MISRVRFLTKEEIEIAIRNTQSNSGAARFLGVALSTYKKYASIFIDETDGRSLYDKHCNQRAKGIHKTRLFFNKEIPLNDILNNKRPGYPISKLKYRLINKGYVVERCNLCGFDQKRLTDLSMPLLLDQIDGNPDNYMLENLQLLCYNCYFLTVGNIVGLGKNYRKKLKDLDDNIHNLKDGQYDK